MSQAHVWQTLLGDENWTALPKAWLDNKPGAAALLFRTHRSSDPCYGTDQALLHAAPRPLIGTSANRLNSQRFYEGAPHPFNFISVYQASAEQIFYPDETLAFVRSGKSDCEGDRLENIDQFDPVRHFETDATGCPFLGTFLVLLPRDPKTAFSLSVDKANVKILPVTPAVESLLQSLIKIPPVSPRTDRLPTQEL